MPASPRQTRPLASGRWTTTAIQPIVDYTRYNRAFYIKDSPVHAVIRMFVDHTGECPLITQRTCVWKWQSFNCSLVMAAVEVHQMSMSWLWNRTQIDSHCAWQDTCTVVRLNRTLFSWTDLRQQILFNQRPSATTVTTTLWVKKNCTKLFLQYLCQTKLYFDLSLIHIWRCRRSTLCRSRWSPYH